MNFLWIIVLIVIVILLICLFSPSIWARVRGFFNTPEFRRIGGSMTRSLVVPWIRDICGRYNPWLKLHQKQMLVEALHRAIEAWEKGRPMIPLIRPIIALAVPMGDHMYDLVNQFYHYWNTQETTTQAQIIESKTSPEPNRPDDAICLSPWLHGKFMTDFKINGPTEQKLMSYGIDSKTIESLPVSARLTLLQALSSDPTCGITMDALVNAGKLESGVVLLIKTQRGVTHAFLYRRSALDRWFNTSASNPLTREPVNRATEYFILS